MLHTGFLAYFPAFSFPDGDSCKIRQLLSGFNKPSFALFSPIGAGRIGDSFSRRSKIQQFVKIIKGPYLVAARQVNIRFRRMLAQCNAVIGDGGGVKVFADERFKGARVLPVEAGNPLCFFLSFPCWFLEKPAEQLERMKKIKLYFLPEGNGLADFFLSDQEWK